MPVLAAIYNGYDYAFDLNRSARPRYAPGDPCLDSLKYDPPGTQEVHRQKRKRTTNNLEQAHDLVPTPASSHPLTAPGIPLAGLYRGAAGSRVVCQIDNPNSGHAYRNDLQELMGVVGIAAPGATLESHSGGPNCRRWRAHLMAPTGSMAISSCECRSTAL